MKKILPMMAIVAVLVAVAYLVTLWPIKVVIILLTVACVAIATYCYKIYRPKRHADSHQVRVFGTVRELSPSTDSNSLDLMLGDGMKYHVIHPHPMKPNRLMRVNAGDEVQLQYYDDGMWELVEHRPRQ